MTRILYLHGFASGPASSKARHFAAHFEQLGRPIEIADLAAGDFEHLTITGQLQVVERLAAGEPVSLIGSSMGGYLAALYASAHPEARRLVLLAPAFGFTRRWPKSLGEDKVAQWKQTGWMDVFHYADGRMRRLHWGLLADGARFPDYPDFSQPALIFHGTHDDVVPASLSEEFAAGHPNVRLELLDSGHELHNVLPYMADSTARFLL